MKHAVSMIICAALLMPAIFAGCLSGDSSSDSARPGVTTTPASAPAPVPLTHRLKDDTVYYDHPAQARPPNGTIKKGTRVAVVQPAGSYTLIRAEDGTRGYVATGSLEPLRP